MITWTWRAWRTLDADTLYAFLRLRSEIFVVEQNCVFLDMDGLDSQCEHLCGSNEAGTLIGYLRLVPPGVKSPQPALGRLVIKRNARGQGLSRTAIEHGLRRCAERYPNQPVFLSGQQHLEAHYASMGFATISAPYLEDGIWHVNMLRPA